MGSAVPDSFAAVGALFNPALSWSGGAAGGSVSETSSGLDASSDAVSETLAAAAGTGIGGVWLFASVCFFRVPPLDPFQAPVLFGLLGLCPAPTWLRRGPGPNVLTFALEGGPRFAFGLSS